MSNYLSVSLTDLIRQSYHPFSTLTDALCCFLQAAIVATQSSLGEILMRDPANTSGGSLSGVSIGEDGTCVTTSAVSISDCSLCTLVFTSEPSSRAETRCARFPPSINSCIAWPLRYQNVVIGLLTLGAEREGHYTERRKRICDRVAREIAIQAKRYEMRDKMKRRFREDLMLIGISDALRKVEYFIEKASSTSYPALILGEFGLEKRHVAYSLHLSGGQAGPFVEVNCAYLDKLDVSNAVPHHLSRAQGGTAFFHGIDQLEYGVQRSLSEVIASHSSATSNLRLIASGSDELAEPVDESAIYRPLLAKFDYLLASIAPLRARREDIKPLTEFFLTKHSNGRVAFSDEVLSAFEAYDWPLNLYELERVVARLVVLSERNQVQVDDLYRHAPYLLEPGSDAPAPPATSHRRSTGRETVGREEVNAGIVRLAHALLKHDFGEIKSFHPALQNALEYLAKNLHETITLHDICRHSGLSASHLAYLFQKTIGMNFKPFLSLVRIEEAKELLAKHPHMRITEVSFSIGFGDLRHFERTFRRLVGKSPREYRQLGQNSE